MPWRLCTKHGNRGRVGAPQGQEHPLHTDLGGGSRRRGKRDPSSSQGMAKLGESAALEDLEGICSLWVENQRRHILGRKDIFVCVLKPPHLAISKGKAMG